MILKRFIFFPLGINPEMVLLPFLNIHSQAVVCLPPMAQEVVNKLFTGLSVRIDDREVILFVVNDSTFEMFITNQELLSDMVSCSQDATIWFIGMQEKLAKLAEHFRLFCKREELHFHYIDKRDKVFVIGKHYKNQHDLVYKLTPVGKEHFAGKN